MQQVLMGTICVACSGTGHTDDEPKVANVGEQEFYVLKACEVCGGQGVQGHWIAWDVFCALVRAWEPPPPVMPYEQTLTTMHTAIVEGKSVLLTVREKVYAHAPAPAAPNGWKGYGAGDQ